MAGGITTPRDGLRGSGGKENLEHIHFRKQSFGKEAGNSGLERRRIIFGNGSLGLNIIRRASGSPGAARENPLTPLAGTTPELLNTPDDAETDQQKDVTGGCQGIEKKG